MVTPIGLFLFNNYIIAMFSKFLITNTKTGLPSYTLTAFCFGIFVINLKLLFSGIEFGKYFKFSEFSGTDYGVALAALGALHVGNKAVKKPSDKE